MDLYTQDGLILRTKRFTLRPIVADDGPAVIAALNHWDVTRWLTQVPYPYTQSDFDWFLNVFLADKAETVWAIDAGDGLMGVVSAASELGYWLAPTHHRKGVMHEAATAACDWYFDTHQQDLVSGYHLGNVPSHGLLTKLGFENTHIDRDVPTAREAEHVDVQRMVLTAEKWRANRG